MLRRKREPFLFIFFVGAEVPPARAAGDNGAAPSPRFSAIYRAAPGRGDLRTPVAFCWTKKPTGRRFPELQRLEPNGGPRNPTGDLKGSEMSEENGNRGKLCRGAGGVPGGWESPALGWGRAGGRGGPKTLELSKNR